MNTMYAAVARRSREVGTLRVLGFSKRSILISFFLESVLLSALGGLLGCLLVLPLNGITTGIGNSNFSETAFNFHVSPADHVRRDGVRRHTGRCSADCFRRAMLREKKSSPRCGRSSEGRLFEGQVIYGRGTQESANRPQQASLGGALALGHALDPHRRGHLSASGRRGVSVADKFNRGAGGRSTARSDRSVRGQRTAGRDPQRHGLHRGRAQDRGGVPRSSARSNGSASTRAIGSTEGQVLVRLEDDEYQAQLHAGARDSL